MEDLESDFAAADQTVEMLQAKVKQLTEENEAQASELHAALQLIHDNKKATEARIDDLKSFLVELINKSVTPPDMDEKASTEQLITATVVNAMVGHYDPADSLKLTLFSIMDNYAAANILDHAGIQKVVTHLEQLPDKETLSFRQLFQQVQEALPNSTRRAIQNICAQLGDKADIKPATKVAELQPQKCDESPIFANVKSSTGIYNESFDSSFGQPSTSGQFRPYQGREDHDDDGDNMYFTEEDEQLLAKIRARHQNADIN